MNFEASAERTLHTDVAIIGAGPCGLFQVFELGLLGLSCAVIDTLPKPGGQCAELYPDKPIYDIPALPVCSGQELVDRLLEQIKPFAPKLVLGQTVVALSGDIASGFTLKTSAEVEVHARAVVIAAGLGAFEPRRLMSNGAAELEGRHLHYAVRDPGRFAGQRLVILGGGDSALDWTLALAAQAKHLTLIHRSEDFKAAPATVARMRELVAGGVIDFRVGNVIGVEADGDGVLRALTVLDGARAQHRLETDQLLVFFGLSPRLGPIAEFGLELEKQAVIVDTERFATSTPGIHAIGDINTYPGKKKLILSGFHEAALAAFAIKAQLSPGQKVHLQYTTTSPLMHQRLGVASTT